MKYFFCFIIATLIFTAGMHTVAAQYTGVGGSDYNTGIGGSDYNTGVGTDAGCDSALAVCLENPLAAKNITQLFETIIDIVLVFAIPIVVFFIIYAGFLYVTARGNASTIQKAHMALLYALIGGLLILGARVLIDVINGTVDVFRN